MRTGTWLRVLVEHVRTMNDLYDRYLLAWPPQPEPLHWVRRGGTWILRGEVLPGQRPD
ncbi:hypothetical protein [Saccharopolyspora shandongensis]|uniref:hypothetical protein n=1 Tax=Saccharopolyspora shandongensis TaxID=418495 RepID=UPI0033EA71CD